MSIVKALIGSIIGIVVTLAIGVALHSFEVINAYTPLFDLLDKQSILYSPAALESLGFWFTMWSVSIFSAVSTGGFIDGSFDLSYIIMTVGFLLGVIIMTRVSGTRSGAYIGVILMQVLFIALGYVWIILLSATVDTTHLNATDIETLSDLTSLLQSLSVTIPVFGYSIGLALNTLLGLLIATVLGKKKKSK